MSTKKLNVDRIQSELDGSAFFPGQEPGDARPDAQTATAPRARKKATPDQSSTAASTLASMDSSLRTVTMLAAIRKTVKAPGREVSFVRISPEEKARLADIVYTYKRQGTKTSENEINRIAVNFILEDFTAHGEASILAQAIAAVHD